MIRVTDKKTGKKTPHLALVHQAQGGSANKRHVSILMKSVDELTDEQVEELTSQYGELYKATFGSLRDKLNLALTKRYQDYDNQYVDVWVRDFDENTVVFSRKGSIYGIDYSVSEDGDISFIGKEIEVKSILRYEDESGGVVLSESDFDEGLKSLITKSVIGADDEVAKSFLESIINEHEVEIKMKDELEKAQSDLASKDAQIAELQAQVALLADAEKQRVTESRTELLKSVLKDEAKAEELVKALATLDEDAFGAVVAQMKSTVDEAEQTKENVEKASDLFTQTSVKEPIEKSADRTQMDALAEVMAQYNK